jgi:hypothetical protein
MNEKTALEEIQFIKQMIEEGKRSFVYNGKDYIFWGFIMIAALLSTYIFLLSHIYFNYFWIWIILVPIGWVFSIYNRIKYKSKFPATYSSKIISYVWVAAGIAMTIIAFISAFYGKINPMLISPITSIIMGGAFFVTGKIVETKWLGNLSFAWWIGGIALFFVPPIHTFLVMALLLLFFQAIPGIIIYRNYKQMMAEKA